MTNGYTVYYHLSYTKLRRAGAIFAAPPVLCVVLIVGAKFAQSITPGYSVSGMEHSLRTAKLVRIAFTYVVYAEPDLLRMTSA